MKIAALRLLAFGPFTDHELDLSAGHEGLHLIFGPNEAGKSSALTAIHDLLYGVPAQSAYDFVHPYQELRLGGTLLHSSGKRLDFVRRKGNKATLRDRDDREALDDDLLAPFLGNVDQELFRSLFGINHERLRQGGEEILHGNGRVGEILFAAAGVAELRECERRLQKDAEALFAPRAQKPQINSGLRQLVDARESMKQAGVSAEDWEACTQRMTQAQQCRERLDDGLRRMRSEQGRLARTLQALPTISRWKETTGELQELREVSLLPDDFGRRREQAVAGLHSAQARRQGAQEQIARLRSQRDDLTVDDELLASADEIAELHQRLGSHRKAMQDRPQLSAKHALAEGLIREVLQRLGRPADLSHVDSLLITAQTRTRVQDLVVQHEGLTQRERSLAAQSEQLQQSISEIETQLHRNGSPVDCSELSTAVVTFQQEGPLDTRRASLDDEIARKKEDARVRLEQLQLWSGTLDACEGLRLPADETIDRFAEAFQQIESERSACQQDLRELDNERRQLEAKLLDLDRGEIIPTQVDLRLARQHRDQGWEVIAALLRNDPDAAERKRVWLQIHSTDRNVADEFRKWIDRADELADRMRQDADRIAQWQQLHQQREQLGRERAEVDARLAACDERESACEADWRAQWRSAAIDPLTPREMRSWLRAQSTLAKLSADIRTLTMEGQQIDGRIAQAQAELFHALKAAGVEGPGECTSLQQCLRYAQMRLGHFQDQRAEHRRLTDLLRQHQRDAETASRDLVNARRDLQQWRQEWTAAMSLLDLAGNSSTSHAGSVLELLHDLSQYVHEARQLALRVEGIDDDAQVFQSNVSEVVARLARDLPQQSADDAVRQLVRRLDETRQRAQERASLTQELVRAQHTLQEAEEAIAASAVDLQVLCELAGCSSPEELREAEMRSQRHRQLTAAQQSQREQLHSSCGGIPLDDFVTQATAVNPDDLGAHLEQLEQEISTAELQRDDALKDYEQARLQSLAMEQSQGASVQAEDCEMLAAQIVEQVRELAVLRVARGALRNGIERYREKNQGPILEHAARLFAELTSGSFACLSRDFDDAGRPLLLGIRPGGEEVRVTGMSDGTRDQLYLALRLASVDNWLRHHEPVPLIVDDILVHFDDQRLEAALRLLADLSARTQVICFTHHAHVIEVARSAVPSDILSIHSLEETSPNRKRKRQKA